MTSLRPSNLSQDALLQQTRLNAEEQRDADAILEWMAWVGCANDDGHQMRVMFLTMRLASALQLAGSAEARRIVIRAGLLHDVGKALIPAEIVNKPGRLSPEERRVIEQHAALGARLAASYPSIEPEVLESIHYHHEQFNGRGYPAGLIGEEIPRLARILAVADVYDALTSHRPYRAAWLHAAAVTYLQSYAGEMFEPGIVDAFCKLSF
ncbi:HD domain-containing protein (plasmid) [Deinococcus radiomollis]|uniref:HD-GYP domain-containing protein n=1 Tax=Deinococcus radiomollis TaxID=468916 RepID=UPI0038913A7B